MEKRTVSKAGPATLTVSLPSTWAKQHNLKPGDKVGVATHRTQLIIRAVQENAPLRKAHLYLKKGQTFRRRYINSLYRDGYDEIEIISEDALDHTYIEHALRQLFGFELIESYPKRILVRNIAPPDEAEFENIFERLWLLNISMMRSLLSDMKEGTHTHAAHIGELESTINKFCFFCQRVLLAETLRTKERTANLYHFASVLEQIGDALNHMCKALSKSKQTVCTAVIQLFARCTAQFEWLYESFYDFNINNINAMRDKRTALYTETYSLFSKKKLHATESELVGLLLVIVTHIKEIETQLYHI